MSKVVNIGMGHSETKNLHEYNIKNSHAKNNSEQIASSDQLNYASQKAPPDSDQPARNPEQPILIGESSINAGDQTKLSDKTKSLKASSQKISKNNINKKEEINNFKPATEDTNIISNIGRLVNSLKGYTEQSAKRGIRGDNKTMERYDFLNNNTQAGSGKIYPPKKSCRKTILFQNQHPLKAEDKNIFENILLNSFLNQNYSTKKTYDDC